MNDERKMSSQRASETVVCGNDTLCFALLCWVEWVRLCLWHGISNFFSYCEHAAPSCSQCTYCDGIQRSACHMEFVYVLNVHVNLKRIRCWNMRWIRSFFSTIRTHTFFEMRVLIKRWKERKWNKSRTFLTANKRLCAIKAWLIASSSFSSQTFHRCLCVTRKHEACLYYFVCHKTGSVCMCGCASVARIIEWTKQKKEEIQKNKMSQDKHQLYYPIFLFFFLSCSLLIFFLATLFTHPLMNLIVFCTWADGKFRRQLEFNMNHTKGTLLTRLLNEFWSTRKFYESK